MNWVKTITDSIDYMEDNLTESITIEAVSKVAMASPFYYQRMFLMLTGMTVFEYIRNRRLSQAAVDLVSSDIKIIDLALKYGYESSESFSRAFKRLHGVNPTTVRKEKTTLKSFPKLLIEIVLKGVEAMDYRIEKKESFKFYGLARTFSVVNGENFEEIPRFWQEVMADGSYDQMIGCVDTDQCIGACMPMEPGVDTEFDYVIGAFCEEAIAGYMYHEVPAVEWAIFPVVGPIGPKIQETWKRIFSEWFPATGFEHLNLPELEVYYGGDTTADDYLLEIWIPIKQD